MYDNNSGNNMYDNNNNDRNTDGRFSGNQSWQNGNGNQPGGNGGNPWYNGNPYGGPYAGGNNPYNGNSFGGSGRRPDGDTAGKRVGRAVLSGVIAGLVGAGVICLAGSAVLPRVIDRSVDSAVIPGEAFRISARTDPETAAIIPAERGTKTTGKLPMIRMRTAAVRARTAIPVLPAARFWGWCARISRILKTRTPVIIRKGFM